MIRQVHRIFTGIVTYRQCTLPPLQLISRKGKGSLALTSRLPGYKGIQSEFRFLASTRVSVWPLFESDSKAGVQQRDPIQSDCMAAGDEWRPDQTLHGGTSVSRDGGRLPSEKRRKIPIFKHGEQFGSHACYIHSCILTFEVFSTSVALRYRRKSLYVARLEPAMGRARVSRGES